MHPLPGNNLIWNGILTLPSTRESHQRICSVSESNGCKKLFQLVLIVELFEKGEFDDLDWGEGSDEPIEAECDLENPEECESCQ